MLESFLLKMLISIVARSAKSIRSIVNRSRKEESGNVMFKTLNHELNEVTGIKVETQLSSKQNEKMSRKLNAIQNKGNFA